MAKALIDQYSDEEFAQIIATNICYSDVLKELGYKSNSGDSTNRVKIRVQQLGLSTDHFQTVKTPVKRTPDNTFIKDSTADQKTLRKLYRKGNYTPYVCAICKQEPFWCGKDLTLILDHINGDNHDDRLDNLRWVCPNCNQQLDTTNGKNRIKYEVKKCAICGAPISQSSTYCISCANKQKVKSIEELPVSREELKHLIRTSNFTSIAQDYHVTDNCIRKWCDKFSLPRRASEIKKISDEDWSKI